MSCTLFKKHVLERSIADDSNYTAYDVFKAIEVPIDKLMFEDFFSEQFVTSLFSIIADKDIEKEWKDSFLKIWDLYMDKNGAGSILEVAYPMLQKYEYLDVLFDRLVEIKDGIFEEMPLLIQALTQIPITEESAKRVLSILEILDWHVYKILAVDIDECLKQLDNHQYIDIILEKICEKENFSLLRKTINAINERMFCSDNNYTKKVEIFAKSYEQAEKNDLLQKLGSNLKPNVSIDLVDIAISVFRKLKQIPEYANDLFNITSTLIPLFNSNHSTHPQWAMTIVEVIGCEYNMNVPALNTYLELLNELFTTNLTLSIKGWKYFCGKVSSVKTRKMFDNFLSIDVKSNVTILSDLYLALKRWEGQLLENPDYVPSYEKLLIECLRTGCELDLVIESIGNIHNINDINSLFGIVHELSTDQQKLIEKILVKQIKGSENVDMNIEKLLVVKDFDLKTFKNIIRGVYKTPDTECYIPFLENISDEYSYHLMINLFLLITTSLESYKKSQVLNLIKHIVRKGRKTCADEIIPILKKMKGYFILPSQKYELKGYIETLQPTSKNDEKAIRDIIRFLELAGIDRAKTEENVNFFNGIH